jgi:hypothetical protein
MSHIVQIKTEVRDAVAVQFACQRLGLEAPVPGTVTLFAAEASGLLVCLPGWIYPAVFDTSSGQVRFDNYGGRWGEQVQLDRFLQAYAVEKATLEARRKGHTVTEQTLDNGSIKLTVTIGGAA